MGAGAFGATVAKCLKYAFDTEIDALARIGCLPDPVSRAVYRVTVAWLHFVQPLARTYGRVVGCLSPSRGPQLAVPQASDLQSVGPPERDARGGVRLLIATVTADAGLVLLVDSTSSGRRGASTSSRAATVRGDAPETPRGSDEGASSARGDT